MRRSEIAWIAGILLAVAAPTVSWAVVLFPQVNRIDGRFIPISYFYKTYTYTVRPGDTLWNLSSNLHVPIVTLVKRNDVSDPHFLQVGDQIKYRSTDISVGGPAGSLALATQSVPALSSRSSDGMFLPHQTRIIFCTLTAYTAGYESTGKRPGDPAYGITSTGKHAMASTTVAVDPRIIPYGTKLYIPGVGYRIAEDTGGAIVGTHIDVFYSRLDVARQFGVQHDKPVYVLPDWYPVPHM